MAGRGFGSVVVVGDTIGELVQAARTRAMTTITTIPSLRTMLVLLPLNRAARNPPLMAVGL
jgi:hypothetical protein